MKAWDLHCDTLNELRHAQQAGTPKSFARNDLHIDLEKLHRGGYGLQCLAAFIYLNDQTPGADPLVTALEQIDIFRRILAKYPNEVAPVYAAGDIARNAADGKLSLMLTIEEGGCCKGSLAVLRQLHALGVRMMTLTWNFANELAWPNFNEGEGQTDPTRPDASRGLTDTGLAFLAEMERLHITVDVSHLSDKGFWDVAQHTARPFAASHSNCRALSPHCRNLTDEMIRTMGQRGCLAGLNYCPGFIAAPDAHDATLAQLAAHAAHFRQVGGIEMIALGSDFDGIGHAPEMRDCGELPLLADALQKAGFTADEVEKIFWGNAARFFAENL